MRSRAIVALAVVLALAASACTIGDDGKHRVIAYFEDVGDLVEAGSVQMNDVEIGSVENIELVVRDGEMVARVTLAIDGDERIAREDLGALIRQTSLLGEQFVQLVPAAAGPPFVDGDRTVIPVERTDRRVDIETFLQDLAAFIGEGGLDDLNRFTHAQALILEGRSDTLGAAIEELDRFTGTLANRKQDVGIAIDRLGSAARTLATNRRTIDSFFDSLERANHLLADQGDELGVLLRALDRFGRVNSAFLAEHEDAINRQFEGLRPVLDGLASAKDELGIDITQLRTFLELFPKSLGGGPGGTGFGDYVQADAVLCESLFMCSTRGEKGDVPGEGS